MANWLTFLLPIAAYIGGVLTKPLQGVVENWIARKNLRRSLYADLGHNLDIVGTRLKVFLHMPTDYTPRLGAGFVDDSFKHALSNPSLFHQIHESKRIRLFYENLKDLARDERRISDDEKAGALGIVILIVSDGLKTGEFDRDLLYKNISPETRELVELRMRKRDKLLPNGSKTP